MDQNFYYIFGVHPDEKAIHKRLLGKFFLRNGHFLVLEDHGIHHKPLEELDAEEAARYLYSLHTNSQRTIIANGKDLKEGRYPDLLSVVRKPGADGDLQDSIGKQLGSDETERVSRFHYHRTGMPQPQELEVRGRKMYLDGYPLEDAESEQVMSNLQSGKAQIRHAPEDTVKKSEPDLVEALSHVRNAIKLGSVPQDALKTISRHLFTDTMVPTVGNRMAYKDFLSRPREGVHIHMDGVGFGQINKQMGFDTGDKAIKAYFTAARQAMDESVGRKQGKLFRIGGDEGHAWVPSNEHAAAFARAFRAKLEGIPALNGVYRFATGLGAGPSPEHAENALLDSKRRIKAKAAPWGQAESEITIHGAK